MYSPTEVADYLDEVRVQVERERPVSAAQLGLAGSYACAFGRLVAAMTLAAQDLRRGEEVAA